MKQTFFCLGVVLSLSMQAQKHQRVELVKEGRDKINVIIDDKPFTSFWYSDTLAKPVLFPVRAENGTVITRGFPLDAKPGEPTDHPHHTGIWFNFENVNGIDFWNNSYAIPAEKKHLYGSIITDSIMSISGGRTGSLVYHANWMNSEQALMLEETTTLRFSRQGNDRIIDRTTILKANTYLHFKDAKDGLMAIRVARELQMPEKKKKEFKDDKGNITIVEADTVSNGNYITAEGKTGDSVWSTRAAWCKMYGKIGADSVSIVIIDHPRNINYPTFWHARGYGLFAANPLGASIFTNGRISTNLELQKGESIIFRYRFVISSGNRTLSDRSLSRLSKWY